MKQDHTVKRNVAKTMKLNIICIQASLQCNNW